VALEISGSPQLPTRQQIPGKIKAKRKLPALRTVKPRVRGNLAYQEKRDKVIKTGDGKGARWSL
jgi:hypothetical protein